MRSEGYGSRRRVCVCVYLSVKSHLTSGGPVRPENAVTDSAGNEGQKTPTAPLPRSSAPYLVWPYMRSFIFPVDNTHAHCAYVSSPRYARCDAPCRKLSLRFNFTMIILKSSS